MDQDKKILWASCAMGAISIIALVVVFIQVNELRAGLKGLTTTVNNNMKTATTVLETKQESIDGLRSDIEKNTSSISTLRADATKLQHDFANLKSDLSGTVAKSINKEIIDAVTSQAIAQAVEKLATTNNDKFINAVAKELVKDHRAALIGPPGKDANDERVATFLLARPEFLDAVSVSILQLQQKQNK
jgi:prophage DNA circulation protein